MFLVWQQINKNEWRLNAKNSDKTKALKAYSGCVKSVGVNKCRFTVEIKPTLDIKAFVVEEKNEEDGKPTIMRFFGPSEKLDNGDWIRGIRDFNRTELAGHGKGTLLQYNSEHKLWELWNGDGQPDGKIVDRCIGPGNDPQFMKIRVYRFKPAPEPEHEIINTYPSVIRTTKFDSRITEMHRKGTLLTATDEGLWTLAGPFDDIYGEIHSPVASAGGMPYLNILVF